MSIASRRRKSGRPSAVAPPVTDEFSIRWQPITSTATPSADIMSSPDPLNESVDESAFAPSSVRRAIRSQSSYRFASRSVSPRKQTFELEVGDNTAPQKLLVTVETDENQPPSSVSTRRKLFQSPTPTSAVRSREKATTTTTTTVPLRDVDDDDLATPGKRGRPRRSNGTPIPKKRRPPTPAKGTPRRPKAIPSIEADQTDATTKPTPRSARRGRPPKIMAEQPANGLEAPPQSVTKSPKKRGRPPKARSQEPTSEAAPVPSSAASSRPGGRRRRQAMDQEELLQMADMAAEGASILDDSMPTAGDDDLDLVSLPDTTGLSANPAPEPAAVGSDIWLAAASDEATPRPNPRKRASRSASASSSARKRVTRSLSATSSTREPSAEPPQAQDPAPEPELELAPAEDEPDFGYNDFAPAASDVSSADDGHRMDPTRNDTIAQGEDFSMIFMDSIPSLQASFRQSHSAPDARLEAPDFAEHEIGEETSLIINNTLETLRQEQEAIEEAEQPSEEEAVAVIEEADEEEAEEARRPDVSLIEEVQASIHSQDSPEQPPQTEPKDGRLAEEEEEEELVPTVISQPQPQSDVVMSDASERLGQPSVPNLNVESPDTILHFADEDEASSEAAEIQSPSHAFSYALARSPRKQSSPLRHQVLKHTALRADRESPSPPPRQEYDSPSIRDPPRRASGKFTIEDPNMYEDSFSEIPDNILRAATPHRPSVRPPLPESVVEHVLHAEEEAEDEVMAEDDDASVMDPTLTPTPAPRVQIQIEEEHETHDEREPSNDSSASASAVAQLDNGRLPTPDDTPPHNESETGNDDDNKSPQIAQYSPRHVSPGQVSYEEIEAVSKTVSHAASRLRPTLSIEEVGGPAPKVTPVNLLSSPLQQQINSFAPENVQIRSARPTLSPIVRAGRVLQSVTSDPPSPENHERHLGSPFRSSASKESEKSSGARRVSMSPPRRFGFPPARSSSVGAPAASDDPFRSASKSFGHKGFLQALGRSGGLNGPGHKRTISQESIASSTRIAPPSEEMSWIANEGPISPRLRGDNSLKDVARTSIAATAPEPTATVAKAPEPAEASQPQEAEPEAPMEEDDDETDIWEFEASRATPKSTRQQPFGRKAPAPILRRGTIPSPWKPGKPREPVREASPELHTEDLATASQLPSDADEFSLLAAQRRAEEQKARGGDSASKTNRFDLSSFFSSPAAIPGMIAARTMSMLGSRANAQEQAAAAEDSSNPPAVAAVPAEVAEEEDDEVEDEEEEEEEEEEDDDDSADHEISEAQPEVAESPAASVTEEQPAQPIVTAQAPAEEPQPVFSVPEMTEVQSREPARLQTAQAPSLYPHVPQMTFEPSPSSRRDLFSPARSPQPAATSHVQDRSQSPPSPVQPQMPTVAQKKDFTPRLRQASRTFLQPSAVVQEHPSQQAIGTRTPPRMQLSRDDIAKWRQQTAQPNDSPDFRRPLLRPLPPRNASPTKSSLRSPMKPHTPGRVVEFTSSVLSPLEQAQVRQSARSSILNPSFFEQPSAPTDGEENEQDIEESDVSMTDASPLSKHSPPKPLSQTMWSREHWLLLDELLHLRRKGPFEGGFDRSVGSEKLVGKTVKSHGAAMTLESWHMDCVDAFRFEVGGWDEGALAKRLFALVLGEQRRARGAAAKGRRVMFH